MTLAEFYRQLMTALVTLGTPVRIWPVPCEVAEPIPFQQHETQHGLRCGNMRNDSGASRRNFRVFTKFRARFTGKVEPGTSFLGARSTCSAHRFSGRTAPPHPSMPGLPDRVTRDAYSHEVSSCGFWPDAGNRAILL